VLAGAAPAAIALIYFASQHLVPSGWAAFAIILSLIAGWLVARFATVPWRDRASLFETLAAALNQRRRPSFRAPAGRDPLSKAERGLLEAVNSILDEIQTLALQRSESEAILRSMTEAVVVTGPRREVLLLNGAARKMFGLAADANYKGHDFVELCRDPRLQEFAGRAAGAGDDVLPAAELQLQIPAPRVVEVNAAPVHQPSGAARVFVFHDITRLKSYETVRSDFIANLTHELRTPITALYGYAETLTKGVDDRDTEQRFLGIIARQSRRLARLLDDLVSLSDLEGGFTALKLEPLAPAQVLEETAELMSEQARGAGVKLEVHPDRDLPPVSADRDRLHQVMINLVDNALKYTPRAGNVRLSAHLAQPGSFGEPAGAPQAPGLVLTVADTGEGIPAHHIPRLTERFYRVDRARSRELGGTGLGLAIVKHIVQLHHGTLRIESRVREGATVSVWLPLESTAAGDTTHLN